MDHPKEDRNQWEFMRNPGPTKKGLYYNRGIHYKFSTILNSINTGTSEDILWSNSSTQMWSTSKDWKAKFINKTGPTKTFVKNKRSTRINGPQLKLENQIMAYRWTFKKDPLKLEKKDFVSDPHIKEVRSLSPEM